VKGNDLCCKLCKEILVYNLNHGQACKKIVNQMYVYIQRDQNLKTTWSINSLLKASTSKNTCYARISKQKGHFILQSYSLYIDSQSN